MKWGDKLRNFLGKGLERDILRLLKRTISVFAIRDRRKRMKPVLRRAARMSGIPIVYPLTTEYTPRSSPPHWPTRLSSMELTIRLHILSKLMIYETLALLSLLAFKIYAFRCGFSFITVLV
jgi:hypothetical protein